MIFGYARVSTVGQDLEQQIIMLRSAGCEEANIKREKITGTKLDRPQFQWLLTNLQTGDTLIVCKLDRFARSTLDAIRTITDLLDRGISVNVLNIGLIANTPAGRMNFTVFSAFAEFERELILERTKAGRELARLKPDYKEGRPPKWKRAQKEHALKLLQDHSYSQVEEITGISISTLTRAKRKNTTMTQGRLI